MRFLAKLEEPAYAALRAIAGFMFAFHGLQKLFGWLTDKATPELFSQKWFGGAIELVCGVLIMLGLGTRLAAFLASGTMAVAYFQFHQKQMFADWHWLPIVNKGELAVMYCFVFLFIAARGPGKLALDNRVR
ncbi:MAG TPA: DoxX family protein [Kofleriaceae bacterium]|nr:DoxX family protein [Kofleriaceae bacterium]